MEDVKEQKNTDEQNEELRNSTMEGHPIRMAMANSVANGAGSTGSSNNSTGKSSSCQISGDYVTNPRLDDIRVSVEKSIMPNSNNFHYIVVIEDLQTGGVAKATISKLNDAIVELINSGSIRLCRPKEAKELQRLIEYAIAEATKKGSQFTQNTHFAVGWKRVGGMDFYLGNKAINTFYTFNSNYEATNVINMVCRGDIDGWIDANKDYVYPNVVPSIVMVSSFVGLLRQRYKKLANDTQLVINLVGPSSVGKTTMVKAAHTVYTSGEEYLGYATSLNSRTKRLALRNPIVASIDDVMQMTSLKDKKPGSINELIFSLSSGMSKDRLGQYGTLQEQERFDSTVLLSSVETMLDKTGSTDIGQLSRLIEIKVDKSTITANGVDYNNFYSALEANCGNAAEEFAYTLLEEEAARGFEKVQHSLELRYIEIKNDIVSKIRNSNVGNTRFANRIAIIILTAELLNEKLKTKYDIQGMQDFLIDNAVQTWNNFNNKKVVMTGNKSNTTPSFSVKSLGTYVKKHLKAFHNGIIAQTGNITNASALSQYIGITDVDKVGNVTLKIPSENNYNRLGWMLAGVDPQTILDMENGDTSNDVPYVSKEEVDQFLKDLREHKLLSTRKGGLSKKLTFVTGEPQVSGYEIVIPKDSYCEEQ